MTDTNTALTISSTKIRQDAEGRYCLNDCHMASKLGAEKRPSKWLVTKQAKDLIAELEVGPNPGSPLNTIKTGGNSKRGTYAAKELVYAYAMWINPKFHLMVIRAFDAMVRGQASTLKTPRKRRPAIDVAFRRYKNIAALVGLDKNQQLIAADRGTRHLTGQSPLKAMGLTYLPAPTNDHYFLPTQLGEKLGGVSAFKVNKILEAKGLQENLSGKWKMTEEGKKYGRLFDGVRNNGTGSITTLKWRSAVLALLSQVEGEVA